MPVHRITSRRQRRGQGNNELLPISRIIHRHASRHGFFSLISLGETLLETSAAGLTDFSFGSIGRGTDRESCSRSLHHHREPVPALPARSTPRQPPEGLFVRSSSPPLLCKPTGRGLAMFQVGEVRPVDMNAIRTGFLTAVYSGRRYLVRALKFP